MRPEKIAGDTYILTLGSTDIGLYLRDRNNAVLIDSGSRPDPGFINFLKQERIRPATVINTHLHIDHIGCNELLCDEFDVDIFASADEIAHENEEGYDVGENVAVCPDNGTLKLRGGCFRIIASRGHSEGHQCVATPDGVCFLGDALMSADNLKLTRMPYFHDVKSSLESMKMISGLDFAAFALSHHGTVSGAQIAELAEMNIRKEEKLHEIMQVSAGRCRGSKPAELAEAFMEAVGIAEDKRDIEWVRETVFARMERLEGKAYGYY